MQSILTELCVQASLFAHKVHIIHQDLLWCLLFMLASIRKIHWYKHDFWFWGQHHIILECYLERIQGRGSVFFAWCISLGGTVEQVTSIAAKTQKYINLGFFQLAPLFLKNQSSFLLSSILKCANLFVFDFSIYKPHHISCRYYFFPSIKFDISSIESIKAQTFWIATADSNPS